MMTRVVSTKSPAGVGSKSNVKQPLSVSSTKSAGTSSKSGKSSSSNSTSRTSSKSASKSSKSTGSHLTSKSANSSGKSAGKLKKSAKPSRKSASKSAGKSAKSSSSLSLKKKQSIQRKRDDDSLSVKREFVAIHKGKEQIYGKAQKPGQQSDLLKKAIQELKKADCEEAVLEYVCIRGSKSKRKSRLVRHPAASKSKSGVVIPDSSRGSESFESGRDVDVDYLDNRFGGLNLSDGGSGSSWIQRHRSTILPGGRGALSPIGRRPGFRGRRVHPQPKQYTPVRGTSAGSVSPAAVRFSPSSAPVAAAADGRNLVFTKNIKFNLSLNGREQPIQANFNVNLPAENANPNFQVTGLYVDDVPVWHEKHVRK